MNKEEENVVDDFVNGLEALIAQWREGADADGELVSKYVETKSCAAVVEGHIYAFKQARARARDATTRGAVAKNLVPERAPAHLAETPRDRQVGGDHYKGEGIQPIDYIRSHDMQFNEGCIVKYVTRWPKVAGWKDLQKVIHYAEIIIEQEGLSEENPFGNKGAKSDS